MSSTLYLKSRLVNSPFEGIAKLAQKAAAFKHRRSHPELAELFLEDERVPLVLSKLLKPTSNTLDVGCHIGSFLSQALKLAPGGKHTAIEASPSKARWLSDRFPNVAIHQVAVADRIGTATFEENMDWPGFSKLAGSTSSPDRVNSLQVTVTTLDSLDFGHRIDFVKIDIEGAELAAFRGGRKFFAENRPSMIFECGAESNGDLDRKALFDELASMNYDVLTFTDFLFNRSPITFDEFRRCGVYPFRAFNFVATPR